LKAEIGGEYNFAGEGVSFSGVDVFRRLPVARGHPDNKLSALPERRYSALVPFIWKI
jgi:hypothetical protein